ncbi:MAG: hypothetical protein F7B20_02060 [Aeropyrum sp.]|nr:hypothetical protein [Aeropyrum sp.]MCE4616141.1 hypothetical protein [Aeropyrum sp.]
MSERIPAGGPYRALAGSHEPLTTEALREARTVIAHYCSAEAKFCSNYVERLLELSRGIAFKRMVDLYGRQDYKGVDEGIHAALRRLVEFYTHYIGGLYSLHGEDVIVKASATVAGEVELVRGEVTTLPPGEAAKLYVAGLVEPVLSNALTLRLKGSNLGEV